MRCSVPQLRPRSLYGNRLLKVARRNVASTPSTDNPHTNGTRQSQKRRNGLPMQWQDSHSVGFLTQKREELSQAKPTAVDRQTKQLNEEFDWAKIKGTVVDVGGGSGHVSLSLAQVCIMLFQVEPTLTNGVQKFEHLQFIVQDVSPVMLAQGENLWTGALRDRVQFKQHDYYQPQPVRDAGAFFVRQVVHNLNDSQFTKLLQAAVPALEKCAPGTPLLINDTVLPNPGEKPAWEEWSLRQMDLCMWVCFGAKQRSVDEFRKLIRQADSRLEVS